MSEAVVETTAAAKVASHSSFYLAMRVLPKPERAAMYAIYGFCREVDDIADDQTDPVEARRQELDGWRADLDSLYAGGDPGRAAPLAAPVRDYALEKTDFLAVLDGMRMDLEGMRGPDLKTLDLYCDRVASAVGRLSVRTFGMDRDPGLQLAHHLGRALQLTNILRDLDEDAAIGRLYLPRELLEAEGIAADDPAGAVASPAIDPVCRTLAERAHFHYGEAEQVMAAHPHGRLAPPRLMGAAYSDLLARMQAKGWAPPRERVRVNKLGLLWRALSRGLLR
jgi:phytoene synthase